MTVRCRLVEVNVCTQYVLRSCELVARPAQAIAEVDAVIDTAVARQGEHQFDCAHCVFAQLQASCFHAQVRHLSDIFGRVWAGKAVVEVRPRRLDAAAPSHLCLNRSPVVTRGGHHDARPTQLRDANKASSAHPGLHPLALRALERSRRLALAVITAEMKASAPAAIAAATTSAGRL